MKKKDASTSPSLSASPTNDSDYSREDLGKVLTSFLAISKKLVELDDAIDITSVEFEPNIDPLEWQVIRQVSGKTTKDEKMPKNASFPDCLKKSGAIYSVVYGQTVLEDLLRGIPLVTRICRLARPP